jgi:hypothetical protein
MHRGLRILAASFVVLCVWATVIFAQGSESLPLQPKHYGSIPYLSGGTGLDEREALNQVARDYNLKLSFALASGNYLGDVAVEIRDAGGRVAVQAVSEGPWFFAKLPPGRYTVLAKVMDKTQQKAVQVTGKGQTVLNLFWK